MKERENRIWLPCLLCTKSVRDYYCHYELREMGSFLETNHKKKLGGCEPYLQTFFSRNFALTCLSNVDYQLLVK